MDGMTEAQALASIEQVVEWVFAAPETTAWGGTTGTTAQRGRILATKTHDGTLGMSTYSSVEDAQQKAQEMERAYRQYLSFRDRGDL